MMLMKPRRADAGALVAEATTRAFLYALGDVPYWATLRALRSWYRGEAESWSDPKGKYCYKWMPDPAELREIAKRYVKQVRNDLQILDDILNAGQEAVPRTEPDERNAVSAIVAGAIKGGALTLIEPEPFDD
jgi:hypothetical protein